MTARRFSPTQPIEVTAHPARGAPVAFRWRGRRERVAQIEADWEVTEGWWRGEPEATRRCYYRLVTRDRLLCIVYRDLGSGRWYLEQVID